MATEDDQTSEETAEIPCPPCRGTGKVTSNLGGSPSTVTCPWCEGGGILLPDHDAQAAKRADAPADQGE
ncbi:MAG: hypothetical protein JHC95_04090 [Solirubrobacteraceae bacterium]|nr:hypothetical protein [Solirubrobacteraceae bacterium]